MYVRLIQNDCKFRYSKVKYMIHLRFCIKKYNVNIDDSLLRLATVSIADAEIHAPAIKSSNRQNKVKSACSILTDHLFSCIKKHSVLYSFEKNSSSPNTQVLSFKHL